MTSLNVAIFAGGLSWPIYVAQDHRFFTQCGLDVQVTEIQDSVAQIKGLFEGTYDIAMTPFDNVVAYQEDQGEQHLSDKPDLFAFMGGISSSLRLLTRPDVASLEALRGKAIGIDAEHTGYTLALYELLAQHALLPGSYSLTRAGGTSFRVEALKNGKICATMVSSPQEIAPEQEGYRRLGDVQTMIGPYQALCGVARRSWAANTGGTLRTFISAYVDASDWLSTPANLEAACIVFRRHVPHSSDALAQRAWQILIGGSEGFQAGAKFDPAGADTVLRIRSRFGRPTKLLTDWTRYVDESFYQARRSTCSE